MTDFLYKKRINSGNWLSLKYSLYKFSYSLKLFLKEAFFAHNLIHSDSVGYHSPVNPLMCINAHHFQAQLTHFQLGFFYARIIVPVRASIIRLGSENDPSSPSMYVT